MRLTFDFAYLGKCFQPGKNHRDICKCMNQIYFHIYYFHKLLALYCIRLYLKYVITGQIVFSFIQNMDKVIRQIDNLVGAKVVGQKNEIALKLVQSTPKFHFAFLTALNFYTCNTRTMEQGRKNKFATTLRPVQCCNCRNRIKFCYCANFMKN